MFIDQDVQNLRQLAFLRNNRLEYNHGILNKRLIGKARIGRQCENHHWSQKKAVLLIIWVANQSDMQNIDAQFPKLFRNKKTE